MAEIVVRDASPADARWLRDLLVTRWGDIVVSRGVSHRVTQLPALVAELDGVPAGALTFFRSGHNTEVVSLDAVQEGRGIGTALMKEAHQRFGRIILITTNDNVRAQRFYERLGMKLLAVRKGAVTAARSIKPTIPLTGYDGVPIEDELEYGWSE
jgi:GNAT superfamily N-acetyltransferase